MNLGTKHNKIANYLAVAALIPANIVVALAFIGLIQDDYRIDVHFRSSSPMVQIDLVVPDPRSQLSIGRLLIYIESFFKATHSGQVCNETPADKANRIS